MSSDSTDRPDHLRGITRLTGFMADPDRYRIFEPIPMKPIIPLPEISGIYWKDIVSSLIGISEQLYSHCYTCCISPCKSMTACRHRAGYKKNINIPNVTVANDSTLTSYNVVTSRKLSIFFHLSWPIPIFPLKCNIDYNIIKGSSYALSSHSLTWHGLRDSRNMGS